MSVSTLTLAQRKRYYGGSPNSDPEWGLITLIFALTIIICLGVTFYNYYKEDNKDYCICDRAIKTVIVDNRRYCVVKKRPGISGYNLYEYCK